MNKVAVIISALICMGWTIGCTSKKEPALSMLISKVKKQHAKYPNEERWLKLLNFTNKYN